VADIISFLLLAIIDPIEWQMTKLKQKFCFFIFNELTTFLNKLNVKEYTGILSLCLRETVIWKNQVQRFFTLFSRIAMTHFDDYFFATGFVVAGSTLSHGM